MSPDTPPLALVTGAGTGIGRAVAFALAARGHRVLALGRRPEPLAEVHRTDGTDRILSVVCDVTEPGAVREALDSVPGRLDVVVAAAGTFTRGSVLEQPWQDWEAQVRVNLHGVFHTLQATTSRMLTQDPVDSTRGHVFTLNSGAGVHAFPNGSAYAAAKHGLRGLVESLRDEVTGQAIKVTDLVVSATVESEMSASRPVEKIPASTVAHTVTSCLDLGGIANWDRVDLSQLR